MGRHSTLLALGLTGAAWSVVSNAEAICPPLSQKGLESYLKDHGPTDVYFFASWCVECIRHIKEAPAKGAILIATFDEQASAEKAYTKIGGKAPCFMDKGVAEAFGIKALPTVRRMP